MEDINIVMQRLEDHLEFHKAIDSHKSDVAFLEFIKEYIEGLHSIFLEQEKLIEEALEGATEEPMIGYVDSFIGGEY